jgi:hypothetical protein
MFRVHSRKRKLLAGLPPIQTFPVKSRGSGGLFPDLTCKNFETKFFGGKSRKEVIF